MEQKIGQLAAMALLLASAWLWGRCCGRQAAGRGWDGQKAGRMSLLCLLIAAPVLVLWDWRFFPALPLMMTLSRWSCFRALRPGERYSDLEERFPAVDRRPIALNLNQVDHPEENR